MSLLIFTLSVIALDILVARFGVDSRPTIAASDRAIRWI